ncbi:MAG: putative quorum-sensing-regulated virulence factor [Dehalococcoidia bacterium]
MSESIRSQLFRVIDVETTGLDRRSDGIVDLAWALMRGDGQVLSIDSTLINPGRPIPVESSAVHNIYDRDVEGAPSLDEAVSQYEDLRTSVAYTVCHNASFDSAFLQRSRQFISNNPGFLCTLRLAENLIPGSKSYKLEHLVTQLDLAPLADAPLHSARGDVAVTCSLLKYLIDLYLSSNNKDNIEGLQAMATIQRMPFGKHKGMLLPDIPGDYVDWLLSLDDIDDDLRGALRR